MIKIVKVENNIVKVQGKHNYQEYESFKLGSDTSGFVISATETQAYLLVTGDVANIKTQQTVKPAKSSVDNVELYNGFFGQIISPFGQIIGSSSPKKGKKIGSRFIFSDPPEILDRKKLDRQLETGILTIDLTIPVGKGQRELIIGDRATGKTTIALNTIINQKNKNVKTIYVAIGKKQNSISSFYQSLKTRDALDNVILMFANPDLIVEQFLAPSIAMTMAEIMAHQGEDVLVVFDDLSKHANVYREISLLINKSPGREAYPTDMFFQHSKVLERAGQFNKKYKNGSITCLPIVETVNSDFASLIPSNVISITDGQIFTSNEKYNNGEFPAINIGLSVSRTGSSVQNLTTKKASKDLRATYLELFEMKKFADMSVDVSDNLLGKLKAFKAVNQVIYQFGSKLYSKEEMFVLSRLFWTDSLVDIAKKHDFFVAFFNFCKVDQGAKIIVSKLKTMQLDTKVDFLDEGIKVVFGPLAKACANDLTSIISPKELKTLTERGN